VCLQGEDWEYEDDRADDDLEMGKDEDADMPAPRRHGHTPVHPASDLVACSICLLKTIAAALHLLHRKLTAGCPSDEDAAQLPTTHLGDTSRCLMILEAPRQ
jgi:hypothetical protein